MGNRADFQYVFPPSAKADEKPKEKKPSFFEIGFQVTLGALAAVGGLCLAVLVLQWLFRACCSPYPYGY